MITETNPIKDLRFDDQLADVDLHLSSAPLAIRRFTEQMAAERPTLAMKRATDGLLQAYTTDLAERELPVSVSKLCSIFGIGLIGKRPTSAKEPLYSLENYRSRHGHTGNLFFKGQQASIRIPNHLALETARISVAHEIGHLLIHRRESGYDEATLRLPSSLAEEALAEYGARLLLIPGGEAFLPQERRNLAEHSLVQSSRSRVTLHSSVTRLGDPDVPSLDICGAILWRMNRNIEKSKPLSARLTPQWHLCPKYFVPVGKCGARQGSLVAELAEGSKPLSGSRIEDAKIGSFVGRFRIDVCAWGSVDEGTRLVLSIFRNPS